MALDFTVFSDDETDADVVSLEWDQHDVLMTLAEQLKLHQLMRFEDYFEEVDVAPPELPALSEDLNIVRKSAAPAAIVAFARELDALVALAVRRHQPLTAIPD
jgi:hypothetical protein